MPEYDPTFDPPAPLANAVLRDPGSSSNVTETVFLLDTGAEVSLVPRPAVERLGLTPSDVYHSLVGFDGARSLVPEIRLEIVVCRRTFRGQFLVTDDDLGILGRNVLNRIPLLFDGPRLQWQVHRSS